MVRHALGLRVGDTALLILDNDSFSLMHFPTGLFNAQYMIRIPRIALMPPKAMRCRPSETL
jgi:hypothetical protein